MIDSVLYANFKRRGRDHERIYTVGAGTYTITARATDNAGAITTSSAVTIVVNTPVIINTTIQSETACSVTGILSETKNAGYNGGGYVNVDNAAALRQAGH